MLRWGDEERAALIDILIVVDCRLHVSMKMIEALDIR